MYRIELIQGDKILFAGLWKKGLEEAKQELEMFEVAIKEANSNELYGITVPNQHGLPTILTKNILLNSITTLTEELKENEKKKK